MYSLSTLLLSIVFLCSIPAYIFGRKGIRESLIAAEDGVPTRNRMVLYQLAGIISVILLLYFAYNTATLLYGCAAHADDSYYYYHAFTSGCSTILCAWVHIHTRRARQRNQHKHLLSHRLSSLVSGTINSVGFVCLFMGLAEPAIALLGVLVFVLRYMISYTAHKK